MNTIPIEIVAHILSYSKIHKFGTLATTCKLFLRAVKCPYFWMRIYKFLKLNVEANVMRSKKFEYHIPVLNYLRHSWNSEYKSDFITVSKDALIAERVCHAGNNPAIFSKRSLKVGRNPRITFKIISCGVWLSIGLADKSFVLDDGAVVGCQQCNCVGLYYHGSTTRLRGSMANEVCSDPDFSNDCFQTHTHNNLKYMSIRMNFVFCQGDEIKIVRDETSLNFYLNGTLVKRIDQFSKDYVLYPCVSLSYGSSVKIV